MHTIARKTALTTRLLLWYANCVRAVWGTACFYFPEVIFLDFSYTLVRSGRKTVSLEIRPDGSLLVRAPRRMSDRAVREFVRAKEPWLREKLLKYQNRPLLPRLTEAELAALKAGAKEDLTRRTEYWAPRVGVGYGKITIRCQKTRWGSCSVRGNLNFNCLLLLAPPEVRDYVVIHELCHRKEMNHSPAFWAEVARACPEHHRCRKWLQDNGGGLLVRLPE